MPAYQGEHEGVLRPFFDAMRYKLVHNKHRGKQRWEEQTVEELLVLLEREVHELKEAIAGGNMTEIMMEAADIGNFAMMVQAVAIRNAMNGKGGWGHNIMVKSSLTERDGVLACTACGVSAYVPYNERSSYVIIHAIGCPVQPGRTEQWKRP